jgi:hypothetical protein
MSQLVVYFGRELKKNHLVHPKTIFITRKTLVTVIM